MSPTIEIDDIRSLIRTLMRERGSRLLAVRDIYDRLKHQVGPSVRRETVESAVDAMERDGELAAIRGKRYSLLEFTPYYAGRIRIHSDGEGIVHPNSPTAPDLYLPRRGLRGAMNGDLVLVRAEKKTGRWKEVRGKRMLEGEVVRVLRRAHSTVVGRFHSGSQPWLVPFDIRLDTDVEIDPESTLGARDGEMVDVEIDRYPTQNTGAAGRVIEKLGMIGEPGVDIEVVIRKYHIPYEFPPEVIAAAEAIDSDVEEEELARRHDFRDRVIVTIDGETAKDFDDAVEVSRLESGNYRLGVHIADVSHYVTEGSALDREAFERGTSVYFPGRAVPMLPERLSNGICSLNPRVDRLTFSAILEIDRNGHVVNREFVRSAIRTRERMTYTDVNAILTGEPDQRRRYEALLDDLDCMHELYRILRKRRESRGSIDFDLPEADISLGEAGEIESIQPTERNVAHRLIEEFMLAANEAVARHLALSDQPAIYRVHQPPDPQKLEDLRNILLEFRYRLRGDVEQIRPGELQRILKQITGTPEERFLTELVLRSMKRAYYLEDSAGHFALALEHYCHFTSPIRRYPDLVVHRRLGELLDRGPLTGERRVAMERRLPGVALQSSERERRAESADREVLEWKKVIFMRDKVGLRFEGIVTGVMPFGLFVELDEIFVQGLVPVASIGGEYWMFAEREHRLRGAESGRELRLGDRVAVEVESVDEDRRQISFRLAESGGEPVARRAHPKRRQRR